MLREGSEFIDDGDSPTSCEATRLDWRAVDRALRDIALRRAKLDAEEARWLREAERLQIWRPLGMVSALDYLERVLGHTPHVANERLRVARALGDLPVLSDAFPGHPAECGPVRMASRRRSLPDAGLYVAGRVMWRGKPIVVKGLRSRLIHAT